MKTVNLGKMDYDGSQLRHCFAYEKANVLGPTISYFIGAADVKEHLVDLEDALENDFIKSEMMCHFVIELPNATIQEAVTWQRLCMRIIADHVARDIDKKLCVEVDGDDIMIENEKLSVSIATLSRFGGLIHIGINVHVGEGCPVAAIGLADIGALDDYAGELGWCTFIANRLADEYDDITRATYKVREV